MTLLFIFHLFFNTRTGRIHKFLGFLIILVFFFKLHFELVVRFVRSEC